MNTPSPNKAFVRAYTERPGKRPLADYSKKRLDTGPSPYTLVFDCETSVDAAQQLRFGFYQVRKQTSLKGEGIFLDADSLSETDIAAIRRYATERGLEVLDIQQFRKQFLRLAYKGRASVVGFNLPFDLSRIALRHTEARGDLRGGFSFSLTDWATDPNVRVKHLSSTAALIDFSKPASQQAGRGMRNRNFEVPHHRGYFIDLRTLSSALLSRKFSLKVLAEHLKVSTQKHETEEHGGPITEAYLNYARADVQATWECYGVLKGMYAGHKLEKPIHKILSEASMGKAYLEQMAIQPLLKCQADIPRETFGRIMPTYFGGRAEAHIRRLPVQVLYADFKSMYPTVNALMGLWDFVIADGFSERDTTVETQALLDRIQPKDMHSKETWKLLRTLVQLKPSDDVLPVRAQYTRGKDSFTIGLNRVTAETPMWYTLADCIASKFHTNRAPQIEKAISYDPGPKQTGLKPIELLGNPEFAVDPRTDDVFTRLIDLRDNAKAKKNPNERAIKIIANSTSYGIFVEVNRDSAPKPEELAIYGADGISFIAESHAIEEPGRYFNPLLATLITGAARLMLTLAEVKAADQGLDWAFCDTDSIAMARPAEMPQQEFFYRAHNVVDWFSALNPYRKPGSILNIEDANKDPITGQLRELYCLVISSKRYALFNIDTDGKPIIRKASAHGLGHLMDPYGTDSPALNIPDPKIPLHEIGLKLWQYDYWFVLISAALSGDLDRIKLDYRPALEKPVLSRYGATSPALLRWMKSFNDGKSYKQQVRPFGFMVGLMPLIGVLVKRFDAPIVEPVQRGRPKMSRIPKPIAPFERDPKKALEMSFDRETGESTSEVPLKSYADALRFYHRSPEDKFLNGGPADKGRTERRHIFVESIGLIGKEANKVGEAGEVDPLDGVTTEFTRNRVLRVVA